MKPHKHAELIKAWADGSDIEHWCPFRNKWIDFPSEDLSDWSEDFKYRIKPEPKPDVVKYVCVTFFRKEFIGIQDAYENNANLAIYFDGETGELKSAEVIK